MYFSDSFFRNVRGSDYLSQIRRLGEDKRGSRVLAWVFIVPDTDVAMVRRQLALYGYFCCAIFPYFIMGFPLLCGSWVQRKGSGAVNRFAAFDEAIS